MRVIVPFAADNPKSRLSGTLDPDERSALANAMLEDVLDALRAAGHEPEVLATAPIEASAPVTVDRRALTRAVNAVLADGAPWAVVMADLGLVTTAAIDRLFDAPGDVVLAPGRAAGTNALVVRRSDFRVDYHGSSYLDHLRAAHELGASVSVIDSHRLSTDIDEEEDLVELLVHGEGRAREWLLNAGFELDVGGGRVEITRA